MDNIIDALETEKKWSSSESKLLITERFKMEQDFNSGKRKKSVLWAVLHSNILKTYPEFRFSKEETIKKFSNLLTTYQRIKQRNKKTGRSVTVWEYWDQFEEMYKLRHAYNPPRNITITSFEGAAESCEVQENLPSEESRSEATVLLSEQDDTSDRMLLPKKRNCKRNDVLVFMEKEAKKDEERFKELITLEKESIAVEKEKAEQLKGLKDILKTLLE